MLSLIDDARVGRYTPFYHFNSQRPRRLGSSSACCRATSLRGLFQTEGDEKKDGARPYPFRKRPQAEPMAMVSAWICALGRD
jgi:hypothetical protein